MALSFEEKREIVEQYGKTATDTGSSKVQIALLTADINKLQDHFKRQGKDHHSRRGLIRKVNQRRKLLQYLKNSSIQAYGEIIRALGLRR